MYEVLFSTEVERDLRDLRAFDRRRVLDAIDQHLLHSPRTPTRNRKILESLVPTFDAVPPLWELRVGDYRVYYDVDERELQVHVRALRQKPPHKTTEDVL